MSLAAQDVRLCQPALSGCDAAFVESPRRVKPDARCPLRPREPCSLCQLGATGPQDCGLVYLVMSDEDLCEGLHNFHRRP